MNKRNFLKSIAALGGSALLPSSINPLSMYKTASAAVDYSTANIVPPTVMPQVINIFLYGGPSELSGNLTNIQNIEDNSQNSYAVGFGGNILVNDVAGDGSAGWITRNGFWRGTENAGTPHLDNNGAGGRSMQIMIDNGQMSVYRTLFKRLDGTRSHRESLLQSFKGSLDIEGSAGVGTKIAATLFQHRSTYEGTTVLADGTPITDIVNDTTMLLPFVSFEGDTRAYQQDPDFQIPLLFRGITLDNNFDNPFSRNSGSNNSLNDADDDSLDNDDELVLSELAASIRTEDYDARFSKASDSFNLRDELNTKIGQIEAGNNDASLPLIAGVDAAVDAPTLGLVAGDRLIYPNNNRFSSRIRAAVTLALVNPSSVYITVGGGLGGWDDHNNGTTNYEDRMNDLFEVMKTAMLHIKYFNANTLNGSPRTTNDNIVINMFGDFGRRVNLNGNQGWDHGNNQNLYTFGGADVRDGGAAALGKVVGSTVRVGNSGTNNQVTEPAPGSYEAEPMSVASTVFSYFGVQNPEVLTADDEFNPAGVPVIDETQPGEPDLF
ncbi:hypothetical protein MNBD_GAMMA05-652 [hydrothermal vent metagenome]|uniref:DUF1501 domain-containing protein n=1 Tax=hydrothermal vent metagenome TaxID=652676 RepID=A0A3B0WI12_9ZZZZ